MNERITSNPEESWKDIWKYDGALCLHEMTSVSGCECLSRKQGHTYAFSAVENSLVSIWSYRAITFTAYIKIRDEKPKKFNDCGCEP